MAKSNRYLKNSKVSNAKFRHVLRLFSLDIEATKISELTNLNRNTINRLLRIIRSKMADECKRRAKLNGVVEADESFFGPRRVKGMRGRGAGSKTIVFGLFKRGGDVYTEIVSNCSKATLQAIVRGKVDVDSVINTDKWRGYDGLVDVGYRKHVRVDHLRGEFVRGHAHINGIEGFWSFARHWLYMYRGMPEKTAHLYLGEVSYRFNHRAEPLFPLVHGLLRRLTPDKIKKIFVQAR